MRGLSFRFLQVLIVTQVAILLLCVVVPSSVFGTEARPEVSYGNIVAGTDFVDSGMSQSLLHRSTLATSDDEALAVSFPAATGPGADGSPADIVSPTIAQTSDTAVAATSTGFFDANYMYCPAVNFGAAPVGLGQIDTPSPVTTALFSAPALMYPEMVVQGNLIRDEDGGPAAIGITLPPAQFAGANSEVQALAATEEGIGAIGFDARDAGLPVILSGRTIDFDATPEQIDQTSIVERLWRNTHQGAVLNYAYEGDAARPVWIAPVKNPLLLIDCGDPAETIAKSREILRPGSVLVPTFWDL